jgi:hypothetical protein
MIFYLVTIAYPSSTFFIRKRWLSSLRLPSQFVFLITRDFVCYI